MNDQERIIDRFYVIEMSQCPASDLNEADHALFHALMDGQEALVRQLIRYGANVNVPFGRGYLLHMASAVGDERSVRLLLDHGAQIDKHDADGYSPLDMAALIGRLSVVDLLLTRGAHVALRTLVRATRGSGNDALRGLIIGCHMVQEAQTQEERNSLLLEMAKKQNVPVLLRALVVGADPNTQNSRGNTALHFASSQDNQRAAETLLGRDARTDIPNGEGNMPLHYACRKGHVDMVGRLLQAGAPINAANGEGNMPIHFAAGYGYLSIVKSLAGRFADLTRENRAGKDPEAIATLPEIKRYLQGAKAAYTVLALCLMN